MAGTRGETLVLNTPGSTAGTVECVECGVQVLSVRADVVVEDHEVDGES